MYSVTKNRPGMINRVCIIFLPLCLLFIYNQLAFAEKPTDYQELCNIYKVIVPKTIPLNNKESEILAAVQKNLPVFFKENFIYIAQADPGTRYSFIKKIAEQELKRKWDCEAINQYYKNEFK